MRASSAILSSALCSTGQTIGIINFGKLVTLSALAHAIQDRAAKGKLEKNSFDALFELEILTRRLTISTAEVARDTHKHTIESALRLVDEAAKRGTDIQLPTVESAEIFRSLGVPNKVPILNPITFDAFYSIITEHVTFPYQQAAIPVFRHVQPLVQPDHADRDVVDSFKSRLDLLHINTMPSIPGSMTKIVPSPSAARVNPSAFTHFSAYASSERGGEHGALSWNIESCPKSEPPSESGVSQSVSGPVEGTTMSSPTADEIMHRSVRNASTPALCVQASSYTS